MPQTQVYITLGIPGSGRRTVIGDLIRNGLKRSDSSLVILPDTEDPRDEDEELDVLPSVTLLQGSEKPELAEDSLESFNNAFVVLPGDQNPVDGIEAWKDFLVRNRDSAELARILTVVHCAFLKEHPKAKAWFDACIHFSDVVLLNHREDAGNKWVDDFTREFKKHHYPCLFEMIKKGGVSNPARVLDTESRRLSLAFDFWDSTPPELLDLEIDIEGDEPDEDEGETVPEDPYFARIPGGRRQKAIPDIQDFL